jgi:hypothetical protein
MEKELFIEECLKKNPDIVVQKYLIDGSCYFFDEIQKNEEFEFKKD